MLSLNLINIIAGYIGYNPYIDFECDFLERNLLNLDWNLISSNNCIPYSFLKKYKDKIVWEKFSLYRIDKIPFEFIEKITQEQLDNHVLEFVDLYNYDIPDYFLEKNIKLITWSSISLRCRHKEFLKKHIDKINFIELSCNSNLDDDFFEKLIKNGYSDELNWEYLSGNICLTEKFYEKRLNRLDWNKIAKNNNISKEFFEKYFYNIEWNFVLLCSNKNLPLEMIDECLINFKDKELIKIWKSLSGNESVPYTFFDKHYNKYRKYYYWPNLCSNLPEIFFEKYSNHILLPQLSGNRNISEKFIEKYVDKKIQISFEEFVSEFDKQIIEYLCTSGYSYDMILEFQINLKKIKKELSKNDIDEYIEKIKMETNGYDYGLLSQINMISKQIINDVSWHELSSNENISVKFFEKHLDKINWNCIMNNRNIPLSFIEKHIKDNKIDFDTFQEYSINITHEDNKNEMIRILRDLL